MERAPSGGGAPCRCAEAAAIVDGEVYQFSPADYVGEELEPPGRYSYRSSPVPDAQQGGLGIELQVDEE